MIKRLPLSPDMTPAFPTNDLIGDLIGDLTCQTRSYTGLSTQKQMMRKLVLHAQNLIGTDREASHMAKFYFRYGTVGSAKTMNLLAVAHNYTQQGKKVVLAKPYLDVRFGREVIHSRCGLEKPADIFLSEATILNLKRFEGASCVLVDECQFLSPFVIDQLRDLTRRLNVPVICYGLRTDFRTKAFPGSQRLLEIADSIEEVKTTCHFCEKKAIFNLKHVDGKATIAGPTIDLGTEEKYLPACSSCYFGELEAAQTETQATFLET